MSSSATVTAPAIARRKDSDRRMFGFFREIRAACQYLQDVIADGLAQSAAPGSAGGILKALAPAVLARVDEKIAKPLSEIEELFRLDVEQFEWCSDYVTRIELTWAQCKDSWPDDKVPADQLEARLKQLDRALDEIVFLCASLSFSPRVNDTLANLRIGQPLDVEFEFGEEFPKNPDLRKRLVLELAQESAVLECGIVDADHGVIYKAASSRREQVSSSWHVVMWLLVGFILPTLLAYGGVVLSGWPLKPSDLERLLVDYVLILVGSGAHLGVDALKAEKSKTRLGFLAMNDWVLWVHVHEAQIRSGILYVWIGYILLTFGVPKLDWSSAFFAGYSIDSVTELFLERFQTVAKTKAQALTALAK